MIDNVSHSSGNVSWMGGSTSIQNIWDLRGERALSSHDVAHRVVITGTYELPFGKKRKWGSNMNRVVDWVAGGWGLSGLALLQSGMPLQVAQSGGDIWDGTQRPNLIGDPSISGRVQDRLNGYFNTAAVTQPPADVPGSAPRKLNYRGPGIRTLDAALLKSIPAWEAQRFEIRLEAQNVTNTPMFADPSGLAFGATNFGQITGMRGGMGPRNMFRFEVLFLTCYLERSPSSLCGLRCLSMCSSSPSAAALEPLRNNLEDMPRPRRLKAAAVIAKDSTRQAW